MSKLTDKIKALQNDVLVFVQDPALDIALRHILADAEELERDANMLQTETTALLEQIDVHLEQRKDRGVTPPAARSIEVIALATLHDGQVDLDTVTAHGCTVKFLTPQALWGFVDALPDRGIVVLMDPDGAVKVRF